MTRYVLADGVLHATIEDEQVLLNTDTGVYHLVNGTGVRVIALMADGRELANAVGELAQESGQPREAVARDVDRFLAAMTERGLLVEAADE